LVDSGADVNVLPYSIGLELGASWDAQAISIQLSGNLAEHEARGLIVTASVGNFAPVRLAFAWTRTDNTPLILGQVNFFMAYDICFFRTDGLFEIRARADR
jgi:hypothetical protein